MEDNKSLIEKRKGIVVVGMISSGKSTFLNSLLGISCLEANDNITTKMVTIIRYNEDLKEPKFYHLKIHEVNEENDYNFEKDGNESIGEKEIIKRISEINKNEAKLSENGEPKYDTLFYMLETNIKNIENKDFLKTHDFYDIPGLNEFLRINDNENEIKTNDGNNNEKALKKKENEKSDNYNDKNNFVKSSNEDMRYIKGIFRYLKEIIEREIIILSSETYYKPQNIQIIEEIKKYLNTPLKDNLIILNKIDISNDREKTIADCKQFYVNNIESTIFNINNNKFTPLNSMQFKNELLMRTDYKYYYLYYFNKYKEQYVNINEEKSKLIKKISFIEFLMSNITEGIKRKEEKNRYLESLANEFDEKNFEFIKKIYEETKNDSNIIIEYGINFDDEFDDDSNTYMKAFYQNFLKKKFPEYSEDSKFILDYFKNFKDKSEDLEKAPPLVKEKEEEEPETRAIKIFKNIFNKLQKYVKSNDENNIINDLSSKLDIIEKFILTNRKIYIPFIGVSSAGKSTILNDIVGYKLFPESLNECTTRGIIIEYSSDHVELREIQIDSNKNYYVFNEKNKVAEGYKQVREYLESLNARYGRSEDKFFYKVKTTIKTFDDLGFDEELKKRILLIDLPGPDTQNNKFNRLYKSERTPYEKLLLISSSFIFVNKGRAIKSTENQKILNKLYNNIQMTSSLSDNEYLKACFFVINAFSNLNENEINKDSINEDLASILFNQNDDMFEICKKEIKSCIFNARNFYYYLRESTLLKDNEALIGQFLQEYLKQDENNITSKTQSFPKFCLKNLELKLKDLGFNNIGEIRKQECKEEFLNKINENFSKIMTDLDAKIEGNDNKIINAIANILSYVEDDNNLEKNMLAYKNSFSKEFLILLKQQIKYSKDYKDKDYIKKLKEILNDFDAFFESNREKRSSNTLEELKKIKEDFDKELEVILCKLNFDFFFSETEKSIKDETKKQKDLVQQYLDEKKSDDEILNIVNNKMKIHLDSLQTKVNNKISDFYEEIKKFTDKIKGIIPNFNQGDVNNINKKYNYFFKELLSINEKIIFNNSELSRTFFSRAMEYLYSWKLYFKKFFDRNIIKEKIDSAEYYLLEDLNLRKRAFNFRIVDQCIKIKDNFKLIFNLSFSDLSAIEEKEWEQCKKLYYEGKESLLSIEKKRKEEKKAKKGEEDEEEEKEKGKILLTFQDISCFGQSSSSVTIPIISACGIQTAILPGALLSNPISKYFSGFYSKDLKNNIPEIVNHWLKEKISFDAFYTDNIIKNQIPFIIEIMKKLAKPNCLRIIDPSMTDNGVLNTNLDKNFPKEMTNLLKEADYILPNITEACFLLGIPNIQENYDKNFIEKISKELAKFGVKNIIITGISFEKGKIGASVYHSESNTLEYYFNEFIEAHFHGIGNVFSSVFTGAILNGKSDIESIKLAADFVVEVIKNTNNDENKDKKGIKFEKYLPNLMKAFEKE